jgi:hypothetical protein
LARECGASALGAKFPVPESMILRKGPLIRRRGSSQARAGALGFSHDLQDARF